MTFSNAVLSGDIENLEWFFERKFPLDYEAFTNAIEKGRLDIVQWLHVHKCQWNEIAMLHAVHHKHKEIIHWIIEQEYRYDIQMMIFTAKMDKDIELVEWLKAIQPFVSRPV